MRLLGRDKLSCLKGQDTEIDKWLAGWMLELMRARWGDASDLLHQFPSAKELKEGVFLFPIRSAKHAIEVWIAFPQGIVLVNALIEYDESNGS